MRSLNLAPGLHPRVPMAGGMRRSLTFLLFYPCSHPLRMMEIGPQNACIFGASQEGQKRLVLAYYPTPSHPLTYSVLRM